MIFEADWQLLLKWHSSYGFLPKAEQNQTLTPHQGGGRKGRSAIDQALLQVVESELIHLEQRPAIQLYLDARHCFDLMVEACHNLACRRHGATDDYLRLHAEMHRLMKYYVCHKFGVSSEYNTYEQHPWHGAGQGAADAALRYIALSDALIDAYHSKIQPTLVHDPTLTIIVTQSIKAFIDDVAMAAITPSNDIQELIERAQNQLTWWNQLIQVTGGALNPTKCCYAFYYWQPDKFGILRLKPPPEDAGHIVLGKNGQNECIPILSMNEGTRYLGVYIATSGSTKTMESHLWKKAVSYTKAFQSTNMTRREAGVLYHSCFLPALTYPFPATWLPPQFLERLLALSTSTILNKMGYHRNLPRSMVFAPRSHGGVGLCHLYHEHGAQQIITLLRHLRAGTPLGKTLEILIRQYQLWSGFQHHILEDPKKCPWISDHWLSYLRTIMSTQNLSIRYASWTIKPLRKHDRYLMEDILQHGLPKHQLEKINACRMYLKVTTLAEITDNTGEALLPQVLTDFHHPIPKGLLNISQSLLKWPTIHLPTAHCWRLWTRTLGTIYTGSPTGTRLIQKLGSWTTHHNDQRFWHWRLHDPDHLVFKSAPSAPTRLAIPVTIRRHTAKFLPTIPTTIPFSGPPVTPHDPNIGHVPLPIAAVNPAPSSRQPEHFATIQKQFRHQLSPWQRPLFGSLRKSHPSNTLYQQLHNKRPLTIVSDASVQKNGHSGFAWIIADDADPLW